MAFRFRKSQRVAPGVRLNFSKSGLSSSFGPRGAKVTVGPKAVRSIVGIPGSGMSWSQSHRRNGSPRRGTGQPASKNTGCGCALLAFALLAVLGKCGSGGDEEPENLASSAPNDWASGPTSKPVSAAGSVTRYVGAAMTANCRLSPQTTAPISERLERGTAVDVTDHRGAWSQVRRPDGSCWISNSLLSDAMPAAAQPLFSDAPSGTSGRRGESSSSTSYSSYRSSGSGRRSRGSGSTYFANCSEARAAGAAPVYAGDPGYAPKLDRDGDGVGCE